MTIPGAATPLVCMAYPGQNGVFSPTRLALSKYLVVVPPISVHSNWQRLQYSGKNDYHTSQFLVSLPTLDKLGCTIFRAKSPVLKLV